MKMMNYKMKEDIVLMRNKKEKMINFKYSSKNLEVLLNNRLLIRLNNLFKKIWLKINLKITKCPLHLYLMNFCKHLF